MRHSLLIILFGLSFHAFSQDFVVKSFEIEGNKKIKTSLVKRISKVKSGVSLDSITIKNDIRQLIQLPAIANVTYQVKCFDGNACDVIYKIEENFTIIPNINIYTTNEEEFAFRLGLNEFNFLGQGIIIGGFYQDDIYKSYGLGFRAPFLFSNQFGIAVNYQDLTTQEPIFFNSSSSDYKYNNTSFEVLGLYQMNFKNRVELGINYFSESYNYKFGATDATVPQNFKIKKKLFKLIYEYNNLDYNYQYVSGFKSILNFQYVLARSNNDLPAFTIAWNDFSYYKLVGNKGNWANRLRLGLSSNDKSPFAPFSVDNNINIRGVGNTIDRGTGAIVFNTEYRHTFYEKSWFALQGNVFVDAGSWRNPGGELADFLDSQNFRVYPGVGLRFIHKKIFNAIFRIDYGYGITKDATHGLVFGIGQYF